MSLPPEIAEAARLLTQEPANKQAAANLIQQLEQQGLSVKLGLAVGPKEQITPELADLIQTHRPALIAALTAPAVEIADSRRWFAEKTRAIDMRRQGHACCGNCIYADRSSGYIGKYKSRCLYVNNFNDNKIIQYFDYCSAFIAIKNKFEAA